MHSHLAKMLGQYITEERSKQGINQKTLAEALDISAQFLGRIERGEVMIPETSLKKAIEFLKLSEKKLTRIYRAAAGLSVKGLFNSSNKRSKRA